MTTAFTASDKETEVLTRIISLDIEKICHYVKDLRRIHNVLKESVMAPKSKMAGFLRPTNDHSSATILPVLVNDTLTILDLPPGPTPERLVPLIRWALEARQTYLVKLKATLSTDGQRLPSWVYAILKLGRYAIASIALLQFASEVPHLFNPMLVEPVAAPPKTQFVVSDGETPLTSVLRRLPGGREADYISRLAVLWGVTDPETRFRDACTLTLPVHAEMQLLNFYDESPNRRPAFRFIGVSKKSCFLCQRFLASHPQSLSVSSCHQKLYLPWRPPPATKHGIYQQYKSITANLSKEMEAVATYELESRLGLCRPVPLDSSEGVSLTGLTDFRVATTEKSRNSSAIHGADEAGSFRESNVSHPLSTQSMLAADTTFSEDELSRAPTTAPTGMALVVAEMVFHVLRTGDTERQDIIALGDVIDTNSGIPSWDKLLDVLKDERGVAFKEAEEFLMVNGRIRVVNQRQFLACVQYLRNAMMWNSDVFVYSYNSF